MDPSALLPMLLGVACLLPLASFAAIVLFGPWMGKAGVFASYIATGAILSAFALSSVAFGVWYFNDLGVRTGSTEAIEHGDVAAAHSETSDDHGNADAAQGNGHGATNHGDGAHGEHHGRFGHGEHLASPPRAFTGNWWTLGEFGDLKITIGYYIDALTLVMFCMVTLIASLIHFYAYGYMHDELHEVTDHEVTLAGGHHLHRPGRFYRFFQYLSLFCFSMLGLVVAGNIAMVFVFWELVGICSYFLIGFYIERKSASNAANKAFIVNRVGDFGMIIGLMALFATVGTFNFGDIDGRPGLFSSVRPAQAGAAGLTAVATSDGKVYSGAIESQTAESVTLRLPESGKTVELAKADIEEVRPVAAAAAHAADSHGASDGAAHAAPYALQVPEGMVKAAAVDEIASGVEATPQQIQTWRGNKYGYWLLVIAGVGIFCGCVGKSAQFPLHVWLPDAMEGPTPVSALVHSATMVAAGVYLAGRFYPVFAPEALLVIAYVGAITLFLAATIALTATDIKRVLAYSTVSQLGYMMLALGVGGWVAGLFHLITHAFFKSLLFMCSGSVIHACHTNEMPKMGGLRHKMPWTAYTMLVGCLAIIGAGLPFLEVGFSGYYSKDSIIAQAWSFWSTNPTHGAIFFAAAAGGAVLTAFYMFRLWFMTFAGEPRDKHIYDHAHESPPVMYVPLVILAVFAVAVAWRFPGDLNINALLEQARPAGPMENGVLLADLKHPDEHLSHEMSVHAIAALVASASAGLGFLLAVAFYGLRWLDPREVASQFAPIYKLFLHKWYFDEIYGAIFVKPVMLVSQLVSSFDKKIIDGFIDRLARWTVSIAKCDDLIDRYVVDGLVNITAAWTWSLGRSLKSIQTGNVRQYVMLIVIGTVALGILIKWSVAATQ